MPIDWAGGYTSQWRVVRVDPESWGDAEELKGVTKVSIDRDCTDDYPLLETGSLEVDLAVDEEFEEGWYRIELIATQGSWTEKHSIATLLMQSGSGTIDRGHKQVRVDGYSVLRPASDRLLLSGRYAPKDMNGVDFVAQLLRESVVAPVETQGSFTLNDYYVFPIGTTYIEAIWTILDAGGYVIQIDGDGVINVIPKPTESSLDLDTVNTRMLMPSFDYELDLTDIPNRYFAYYGGAAAVEVNDDPSSRTSTVARGRYIDYIDDDPLMVNGESLETYARRRLIELNTVLEKYSYTREYDEDTLPFSMVKGTLNNIGFVGDFRVLGQTLSCGAGITVTEKVGLEIKEYG